jgi:hypothetical protein
MQFSSFSFSLEVNNKTAEGNINYAGYYSRKGSKFPSLCMNFNKIQIVPAAAGLLSTCSFVMLLL